MWSKEHGIIVDEDEIAKNKRHKDKYGSAPDLYCEHCNGLGFVQPIFANKIQWGEAMPCPMCRVQQYQNYWNMRYSMRHPDGDETLRK